MPEQQQPQAQVQSQQVTPPPAPVQPPPMLPQQKSKKWPTILITVIVTVLVTLGVIGIVGYVGVQFVLSSLQNSRSAGVEAMRKFHLSSLQIALEIYAIEHSQYPDSLDQLVPEYTSITTIKDPGPAGNDYMYTPGADNRTYSLCAKLEASDTGLPYCVKSEEPLPLASTTSATM